MMYTDGFARRTMTDYKDTLNLPTTDFPMKANLAQREPGILAHWQKIDLYQQLRDQNKSKPTFILHDGPLYANGNIHIGHAVNRILKDIIVKAKTFSGFDTPLVPGWDCHGLPVELNVEKKIGKVGEKLSAKEFRAACRQYAKQQMEAQREAFKRLGMIADWDHPYLTMDFAYEADIMRALATIVERGHVAQGFKPVHWCMDCASALAEAEVEYANKTSPTIDVRFEVVSNNTFPGTGKLSIPIWTTTPWTLPANEAVTIHPEHRYALVQLPQERLFIIEELLNACMARYGITDFKILKTYAGHELKDIQLQHPFYDKKVPLIFGEHVTLDTGTGAVHTAPAHGQEDYVVGLQYKLPVNNPVDEKGLFKKDTLLFAGEHVLKVNTKIIDVLREKNNLLHEDKVEHSYPHCWRHRTPVIFRATPQWFISMERKHLRQHALNAIKKVAWVPEWGQARIEGMIEGRPDWCISRQRYWCMPMGFIVHKETQALHPDMPALLNKIAERVEKAGIDAWYDLDLQELLGDDAKHYQKIYDTLDVWFDSGVSHFAVLRGQMADLYLEGSDQHRGWFQSALLTAVAMVEHAPYKTVLTHGFTVDDKGRKMSKSLGNTIEPEKVINNLGADILRLWISATDYRGEIAVSDEILQRSAEAYRRIRNTMRFLLANVHDFDPAKNLLATDKLLLLDKFILARAQELQTEIIEAYDQYQLHLIYQKLHNFCVADLGGFYLDVIKDRQYTMQKNSVGRRSAQTAIYHVLHMMVRWLAPILSFTAEEIWQFVPDKNKESVFLTDWYKLPAIKPTALDWLKIIELRDQVNKEIEAKRNAGVVGSALEANVVITAPKALYEELIQLKNELRFVLIVSKASVVLGDQLAINISALSDVKCTRCWHRRDDVGIHAEHPEICGRCVDNLPDGKGEERFYA